MKVRGCASPFILASVLFVLGVKEKCSCLKRISTTELTGTFGRIIIGGDSKQSVSLMDMSKIKYIDVKVGDTVVYVGYKKVSQSGRITVEYDGVVTKVDDYGCFVTSGNYKTYLYKHQVLRIKESA